MNNPIYADGAGYVRGRFVPIAEAVLPVTDWGFTRSDVVYDVVHVFKGGFFRLDDHLDRFERSMAKRADPAAGRPRRDRDDPASLRGTRPVSSTPMSRWWLRADGRALQDHAGRPIARTI